MARQAGQHFDRHKTKPGAVVAEVAVELGRAELVTQGQRFRAGGVEFRRLEQVAVQVVDEDEGGGRQSVGPCLRRVDREQFAEGDIAVEEGLDVGLTQVPLVGGDDVNDRRVVRIACDAHRLRILRMAGGLGAVARVTHHQHIRLLIEQGDINRRQSDVIISRVLSLDPVVPGGEIAGDRTGVGELAFRVGDIPVSVEPGLVHVEQAVHVGVADVEAVFGDRRRIEIVAGVEGRCVVVGNGNVGQRDAPGVGHHVGPCDRVAEGDFDSGGLVGVVAVGLLAGPLNADECIHADPGLLDRPEITRSIAAEAGREVACEAGAEAQHIYAAVHGFKIGHQLTAGGLKDEVVLVIIPIAKAELLDLACQQHAGVIVHLAEDPQVISGHTTDQVPRIVHLDVQLEGCGVGPADYYRLDRLRPLRDRLGVERVE